MTKIFDPKVTLTYHQTGEKKDEGEIGDNGLGFYLAAGVDIRILNNKFVFIKATYDKYITGIRSADLEYLGARIGYRF